MNAWTLQQVTICHFGSSPFQPPFRRPVESGAVIECVHPDAHGPSVKGHMQGSGPSNPYGVEGPRPVWSVWTFSFFDIPRQDAESAWRVTAEQATFHLRLWGRVELPELSLWFGMGMYLTPMSHEVGNKMDTRCRDVGRGFFPANRGVFHSMKPMGFRECFSIGAVASIHRDASFGLFQAQALIRSFWWDRVAGRSTNPQNDTA